MTPPAPLARTARRLALLIALSMLVAGCGGEEEKPAESASDQPAGTQATDTAATEPDAPGNGPSVEVSADKTHAVQPGDELTVTVAVESFTLSPNGIGETNQPGTGHYRLYLDEASGDDFLAESGETTVKITVPDDITDGSHPLRAVLFNNDRTPVEPAAEGEVWLIVYRL